MIKTIYPELTLTGLARLKLTGPSLITPNEVQ